LKEILGKGERRVRGMADMQAGSGTSEEGVVQYPIIVNTTIRTIVVVIIFT
jgi:hypothetical protein